MLDDFAPTLKKNRCRGLFFREFINAYEFLLFSFLSENTSKLLGRLDLVVDQFFSSTQDLNDKCLEEWKDFYGKRIEELSDIDFVIETDDEIFDYGFNGTYAVCSEDRKEMLALLKDQKYFCILGSYVSSASAEDLIYAKKPINSWIYECLKSPLGQAGQHGGFGHYWDN